MNDSEHFGRSLRGRLDDEFGDFELTLGSREQLRRRMDQPRRSRWVVIAVVVPAAAATVIGLIALAVPTFSNKDTTRAPASIPSSTVATPLPTKPTEKVGRPKVNVPDRIGGTETPDIVNTPVPTDSVPLRRR
jgi:hypothetical protein